MAEPNSETTWLLLYEYVEEMAEKRTPHREAHLAHLFAAREAGQLLIAGAYGDPVAGGAIAFKGVTKEQVEQWSDSDPYLLAKLVVTRRIEPWKLV
jgi:uncharacterized protein